MPKSGHYLIDVGFNPCIQFISDQIFCGNCRDFYTYLCLYNLRSCSNLWCFLYFLSRTWIQLCFWWKSLDLIRPTFCLFFLLRIEFLVQHHSATLCCFRSTLWILIPSDSVWRFDSSLQFMLIVIISIFNLRRRKLDRNSTSYLGPARRDSTSFLASSTTLLARSNLSWPSR